jgi:hypothetical protein
MSKESIAPEENVVRLREDLAKHYNSKRFLKAKTMGEIVRASLFELLRTRGR